MSDDLDKVAQSAADDLVRGLQETGEAVVTFLGAEAGPDHMPSDQDLRDLARGLGVERVTCERLGPHSFKFRTDGN